MIGLSIEAVTERETIGRLQMRYANDVIPTPEDKWARA